MTVVPGSAVLYGSEAVGVRLARCDRALCHTVDAVHFEALELAYSMPVDRGAIVLEIVLDGNLCSHYIRMMKCCQRRKLVYLKYHPSKPLQVCQLILNVASITIWMEPYESKVPDIAC